MTLEEREKAIEIINTYDLNFCRTNGVPFKAEEIANAFDCAIKALKQESILDEIRAEIEQMPSELTPDLRRMIRRINVLEIFDKYNAERSEQKLQSARVEESEETEQEKMKTQKMIIEISERTFLDVVAAVAKATPMHPCEKIQLNPDAKIFPVGKPKIERINSHPGLKAEQELKWIPVSERLPEKYGEYLITWTTSQSKQPFIGISEGEVTGEYDFEHCRFKFEWLLEDYIKAYPDVEVIAWMPLPEPHKESEETIANLKRQMCDDYCKWPTEWQGEGELAESDICRNCPLNYL